MVFRYFPYANFHEINFDWLLQHVHDIDEWMKQFDPDFVKNEIQAVITEMVESGEFDVFFAEWITPLQNAIDDLTPRVVALESSVDDLNTTVSGHTTAISNLSDTISSNYTELSGYITTINNITIPSVQSDISALSHNLTTLSDDYTAFKPVVTDELADHETRITALENDEPPTPGWQNRNCTFRGQQFATLQELLSAIESGSSYIGDFWLGEIPHPDPGTTLYVRVFVAFHRSNSSAYLIIQPDTTAKRKIIDYGDGDPDGIHSIIDSIVQRNYTTFNSKLSTFNINNKTNSITVWGSLLSATQYFGYPAFDPAEVLNLTVNGKLPFVSQYLTSATNIMLLDDNATDTYAYINSGFGSVGGMLSYSTVDTADMIYPFMVKYN